MNALEQMVKAKKIPQKNIADHLGISRAAVSMQIKKGIRSLRTAKKYAQVLDCNPFFLMD